MLSLCSLLTAEFLAGCAAYAYAMYPRPTLPDDHGAPAEPELTEPALTAARSTGRRLSGANRDVRVVASPTGLRVQDPEAGLPSRRPKPAAFLHRDAGGDGPVQSYLIQTWYTSISAIAVSLWNWIRKRQALRRSMIELQGLDDRALRDIGLTRFDVARIIRGDLDLR